MGVELGMVSVVATGTTLEGPMALLVRITMVAVEVGGRMEMECSAQ